MIKAIVFDFDGTITDSVNIKTKAFAELYKPYGERIERKVVEYHLDHGGVSRFDKFKIFHREFLNIDLKKNEVQDLACNFSNLVIDKVVDAPYISGAFEFISNYYQIYDMYISTATPTNEICEILQRKNLTQYFKDIKGSPTSKVDHVRQFMANNNYLQNEVIFIGDSDSDKEASDENGIHFIAVASGEQLNNVRYRMNNLIDLDKMILSIEEQEKIKQRFSHNSSN